MHEICIFGDSLAKGVVLDPEKGRYVFTQDNFVSRVSEDMAVPIDNFSGFGCTVTKGLKMMERHGGDLSKYDYVALEFGGNDCDFDWRAISAAPDAEHLPNTPLGQFTATYTELVDKVRAAGSKPVILSLTPIDEDRYFSWLSRGLDADGILRWLSGTTRTIYFFQESYNMEVCRMASLLRVPLIDIRGALLRRRDMRDFLCADGIHLNARGHEFVADEMMSEISELLAAI